MLAESVMGTLIIIIVFGLGVSAVYYAGWKDGGRSERERIKKEIKGI